MLRPIHIALSVLAVGILLSLSVQPGSAAQSHGSQGNGAPINGSWIIESLPVADHVELTLSRRDDHHNMSNSSTVPLDQLRGITAAQLQSAPLAHFEVVREAGTLQCEGYLKGGNGGGISLYAQRKIRRRDEGAGL